MAGQHARRAQGLTRERVPPYFSVKEAVFPFIKFPGVDTILGPEMKSTGEVMGIGRSFGEAFAKAQLGAGVHAADARRRAHQRARSRQAGRGRAGATLLAARLRARRDARHRGRARGGGVPVPAVNKVHEGRPHIVDMIKNDEISLIVNTTEGKQAIRESHSIRREAVARKVTYYTTVAGALRDLRGDRPPRRKSRSTACRIFTRKFGYDA